MNIGCTRHLLVLVVIIASTLSSSCRRSPRSCLDRCVVKRSIGLRQASQDLATQLSNKERLPHCYRTLLQTLQLHDKAFCYLDSCDNLNNLPRSFVASLRLIARYPQVGPLVASASLVTRLLLREGIVAWLCSRTDVNVNVFPQYIDLYFKWSCFRLAAAQIHHVLVSPLGCVWLNFSGL